MQELHSENPLKREKHSKKKEKERNSHELEANCMGIAIDDAALEKHDEKKRYKMKEIEVSEVVSLESSDEPESKEEKKKRKRENSHKHENKERKSQEIEVISMEIGSGVTSQEAEASLEKYDKKKGDIEADKDSVVVSREGSAKPESKSGKKKRKKEKSHKHENKERKSQEIEVISMEIGSGVTSQKAEASSEKDDKNKREIEADKDSVVVSRDGSDKPESKTEKKKRKREKSHKHDKPEYSGVPCHEGFVEPESKAEKKKRKREKSGKHDKLEKKSQDIEDNSTQEAEAASEKHDKKKRRKNKEIDVDKDIQVVSQEGFAEESTKDKKRKKKTKKEKSEEEIDISSKESKPLSAEEKVMNKKLEKGKEVVAGGSESSRENVSGKERSFDDAETSKQKKPTQKKPRKSVSFSGNVEVFPLGNDVDAEADKNTERPLVQGKRFTKEEDELLKNAVLKYIEVNQLGNEGLRMVLNCSKYPQARNCWRDIGLSIPWRPLEAVYYRAHLLFERSETRKWEPHEYDTLMRLHKVHGTNWKVIGEELGKHRFQAKDTWRRIENQNRRYGQWSQEEYQALFDLVNLDLTMKAYDEKKTKHGMLRDNISWKAIGKKLATRNFASCCDKWYYKLASPLVKEGHWLNSDDYRLLDALEKQDACCVEDVDWDNLLKHRSGEYCQRRWDQMVRYIGGYREKPFIEQVEVLCNRYCPEMLKYRNEEEALASGSSLHKESEDGEQVKAP